MRVCFFVIEKWCIKITNQTNMSGVGKRERRPRKETTRIVKKKNVKIAIYYSPFGGPAVFFIRPPGTTWKSVEKLAKKTTGWDDRFGIPGDQGRFMDGNPTDSLGFTPDSPVSEIIKIQHEKFGGPDDVLQVVPYYPASGMANDHGKELIYKFFDVNAGKVVKTVCPWVSNDHELEFPEPAEDL
jgi:hypothetical protein